MDRDAALLLLESEHTFPSDHRFHVIVRAEEPHVEEVVTSIAGLLALPHLDGRVVRVPSNQGTYVSLRMSLPCESASVVLDVYAHLSKHPRVIRHF